MISLLKIFQFDLKENKLRPVTLAADLEQYQLKIEEIIESSQREPEFSLSKLLCSSNPYLNDLVSTTPIPSQEIIPFEEIKEFSCCDLGKKSADAQQALNRLRVENFNVKNRSTYKTGFLLFGKQFNLHKRVFFVEKSEGEKSNLNFISGKTLWERWVEELMKMVLEYKHMSYFKRLDVWYTRQFHISLETRKPVHRYKIWKQFLTHNHHCASKFGEVYFGSVEPFLTIQDDLWCSGASYLLHSKDSITRVFHSIHEGGEMEEGSIAAQNKLGSFTNILKNYAGYVAREIDFWPKHSNVLDFMAPEKTQNYITLLKDMTILQDPSFSIDERFLFPNYILDYLFSEDNTIWNTNFRKQYQDMDRPLSHYWINSSHNTYLTGDQMTSESSIESYVRALLGGCRCVEIDVWNGPDNEPIVKHGMTLTTSISLKDVLVAVKACAFVNNSFPVIISIENHSNLHQQRVMVRYFKEIFGKALVLAPLEGEESGLIKTLPSPNQLRGRIIVKGRILRPQPCSSLQSTNTSGSSTSTTNLEGVFDETDVSNKCKCLLFDDFWKSDECGNLISCTFALNQDYLYYIQRHENDKDNILVEPSGSWKKTPEDSYPDLHIYQLWYHGCAGGRIETAEQLFIREDYTSITQFFVMKTDIHKDVYTLWINDYGKLYNCQISTKTKPSDTIYYIEGNSSSKETFPSLYELIEYYMCHPVVTSEFEVKWLGQPVPPDVSHKYEEWFYDYLSEREAEGILKELPLNGAYLGRYEQKKTKSVVISYKYENIVMHSTLETSDGKYYKVLHLKFATLENLVFYYKTHAFHNDMNLDYPVGKNLMFMSLQRRILNLKWQNSIKVPRYQDKIYVDTSMQNLKGIVRAIQDFSPDECDANEQHELRKGDILINVVQSDDSWWSGNKEDRPDDPPKQFCASFVEEIQEWDGPFGFTFFHGSFDIGKGARRELCEDKDLVKHGIKYYLKFKYPDGTSKKLGAKCSKERVDKWVEMINHVVEHNHDKLAIANAALENNVAKELSEVIIYCKSLAKLEPKDLGFDKDMIDVTFIKSFDESTAKLKFRADPLFYLWYLQHALTRIYPKGSRVSSSNPIPVQFWNSGAQMVALNWQTDDKAMQVNRGKFKENGNCGYVLKPDVMFPGHGEKIKFQFNPNRMSNWEAIQLQIEIISARHLEKQGKGPITPIVYLEAVGIDADCNRAKTHVATMNTGLNPYWNHRFSFRIRCPQLAMLQFSVYHLDRFNDRVFLGESTIPVNCIREGFRSVQLNNSFGEPLLSSLLVSIAILDHPKPEPENDEKI